MLFRSFVVNIVDDDRAEQMNLSSGEYPPEVDEFALTGLTAAPGVRVRAPRVAQAPISLECRVAQIIPVGRGPHSLVLGEILYFHVQTHFYLTQPSGLPTRDLIAQPSGGPRTTAKRATAEQDRGCGVVGSIGARPLDPDRVHEVGLLTQWWSR